MTSTLSLFARRVSVLASRRMMSSPTAVATRTATMNSRFLTTRAAFSTQAKKATSSVNETLANKPNSDYYDDTHMHEQFEAIEEMLEKNFHKMEVEDAEQLKKLMQDSRNTFAVEAPNGDADWLVKEELKQIQEILNHSQTKHDASPEGQREKLHESMARMRSWMQDAERTMAVDSPDGSADGDVQEEMKRVREILNRSPRATPEEREEIKARMARMRSMMDLNAKTVAVDAPDGETDGHIKEELQEIQNIIDHAAKHEDKEFVKYEHKMEDAVRKERARDPEHDW